jgi:hypothetical protein
MALSDPYPTAPALTIRKTITLDGGAGTGAQGAVPIFVITGAVMVEKIAGVGVVNLAGASATIALGVTGSTSLFIGATTATNLTAGKTWQSTTPNSTGLAAPTALQNILIAADIIGTVATADVTGGSITFWVVYRPVTANGALM